MSPKNAILILVFIILISFGGLLYLYYSGVNKIFSFQDFSQNKQINLDKEKKDQENNFVNSPEKFMELVEKNNPKPKLSPEEKKKELEKAMKFMELVEENSKKATSSNNKELIN